MADAAMLSKRAPDGLPVDRKRLAQAADWMARLQGEPSEATVAACLRWRQAHPDNETIWQRMCAMRGDLAARCAVATPAVAVELIERAAMRRARRDALKWMVTGGAVAGLAWAAEPWERWPVLLADQRTGTGELRTLTLDDGTRIVMGPGTALDLRLEQRPRSLVLRSGEILITSASSNDLGPLSVMTRDGVLTPVGTRYSVRDNGDGLGYEIAVFDGAVDIVARADGRVTRVLAGQHTALQALGAGPVLPVAPGADAWTHGMLLADRMPLSDFVAQLARYRTGVLRCDPAIARLEVVGTYPLADTDSILTMLPRVLPVRVHYRTRYWVTLSAAR